MNEAICGFAVVVDGQQVAWMRRTAALHLAAERADELGEAEVHERLDSGWTFMCRFRKGGPL